MAVVSLTMGKFIAGIIVAILASSSISVGSSTMLMVGPQGPEGPQGETGPQGSAGNATRYVIEGSFNVTQDGDIIQNTTDPFWHTRSALEEN